MSRKRPHPSLGSHLEWHGNHIRVVVRVPPSKIDIIGKTKLKEVLPTSSPRDAEVLKWAVIDRLKAQINRAKPTKTGSGSDPLVQEAMSWRESIEAEERKLVAEGYDARDAVIPSVLYDRVEEVGEKEGRARARMFVEVAEGRSTPLDGLVNDWLLEKGYAARTEAAFRYGVKQLTEWCRESDTPATIEAINRKIIGQFVTERFVRQGIDPATANKSVTGLRAYWTWLAQRGHVPDDKNPWAGQALKGKRKTSNGSGETDKRPFTDDEVKTLLGGITKQPLSDFCLVAALTGMRRDEIARLKVKHLKGNIIRVPGTKNDNAVRDVPIHPALADLFATRTAGKKTEEYVFHELPEQESDARGRGAPITQAFTRTRRNLKVDDTPPGARQSRVDLHSWRRWFIKKAVTALEDGAKGFTAWTIADVVGHSKEDGPLPMTMGRYPGRADLKALRACVEAVKLPRMPETDAPERPLQ